MCSITARLDFIGDVISKRMEWGKGRGLRLTLIGILTVCSLAGTEAQATWTTQNFGDRGINAICWSGEYYVAVGENGLLARSVNGLQFDTSPTVIEQTLRAVATNGDVFVAVGDGVVYVSADGHDWNEASPLDIDIAFGQLKAVAWDGDQFVALSGSGSTPEVWISTDGLQWEGVASLLSNASFSDMVWDGTRFLATTLSGGIAASSNGRDWGWAKAPSGTPLLSIAFNSNSMQYPYLVGGADGSLRRSSFGDRSWLSIDGTSGPAIHGITPNRTGASFYLVDQAGSVTDYPNSGVVLNDVENSILHSIISAGSEVVATGSYEGTDPGAVVSRLFGARIGAITQHPAELVINPVSPQSAKLFSAINGTFFSAQWVRTSGPPLTSPQSTGWEEHELTAQQFPSPGSSYQARLQVFEGPVAIDSNPAWVRSQVPGQHWTQRRTLQQSQTVQILLWDGERVFASTSNGIPLISGDGWNWVPQVDAFGNPDYPAFSSIAFNGKFYVGEAGGTVFRSSNGVTWESFGGADPASPVIWTGKNFVVFGSSSNVLVTSADTQTVEWTQLAQPLPSIPRAYTVHGGATVVVGDGGMVATSFSGSNWNVLPPFTSAHLRSIASNGDQLVAVTVEGIIFSLNGEGGWHQAAALPAGPSGVSDTPRVIWGNGRFIAAKNGSAALTSADGLVWEQVSLQGTLFEPTLLWTGKQVIGGGASGRIFTSGPRGGSPMAISDPPATLLGVGDLRTLSLKGAPEGADLQWFIGNPGDISQPIDGNSEGELEVEFPGGSVTYWARATSGGSFVDSFPITLFSGQIGQIWLDRSTGGGEWFKSVIWTGSELVATGDGIIARSPDGMNWTISSGMPNFQDIAWNGTAFVGITHGNEIFRSLDGETWDLVRYLEGNSLQHGDKILSDGNRFIIAREAYYGMPGILLYTSADGINWETTHYLSYEYGFRSVAVGGGEVLVNFDSSGIFRVQGNTFVPTLIGNFVAIERVGDRFIALGYDGTVHESSTGESWTATGQLQTWLSPETRILDFDGKALIYAPWYSAFWSENEQGMFVEGALPTQNGFFAMVWTGTQLVGVGANGSIFTSGEAGGTPVLTADRLTFFPGDGGTITLTLNSPFNTESIQWFRVIGVDPNLLAEETGASLTVTPTGPHSYHYFARVTTSTGVFDTDVVTLRPGIIGLDWQTRLSQTEGATLRSIRWNGNQFLALGRSQNLGQSLILTSPDGVEWQSQAKAFIDAVWDGERWLASTGDGTLSTSLDGLSWEFELTSGSLIPSSGPIVRGNDRTITVYNSDWDTMIWVKPDGKNWQSYPAPTHPNYGQQLALDWICHDGYSFFALGGVSGWGQAPFILQSKTGTNWEIVGEMPYNFQPLSLDAGSSGLVMTGRNWNNSQLVVLTSPDGADWTESWSGRDFPPMYGPGEEDLSPVFLEKPAREYAMEFGQFWIFAPGLTLFSPDGTDWEIASQDWLAQHCQSFLSFEGCDDEDRDPLSGAAAQSWIRDAIWSGTQFVGVGVSSNIATSGHTGGTPVIHRQPTTEIQSAGWMAQLEIGVTGSDSEIQWFYGARGEIDHPVSVEIGGNSAMLTLDSEVADQLLWARITRGNQQTDSREAQILWHTPGVDWADAERLSLPGVPLQRMNLVSNGQSLLALFDYGNAIMGQQSTLLLHGDTVASWAFEPQPWYYSNISDIAANRGAFFQISRDGHLRQRGENSSWWDYGWLNNGGGGPLSNWRLLSGGWDIRVFAKEPGFWGRLFVNSNDSDWGWPNFDYGYWFNIPATTSIHSLRPGGGGAFITGSGGYLGRDRFAWHQLETNTTQPIRDVAWGPGVGVAVGTEGSVLMSEDGGEWSAVNVTGTYLGVAYGEGRFVAVGSQERIITSIDGIQWTTVRSASQLPGDTFHSVVWTGRQFVAMGAAGTVVFSGGAGFSPAISPAHHRLQQNESLILRLAFPQSEFWNLGTFVWFRKPFGGAVEVLGQGELTFNIGSDAPSAEYWAESGEGLNRVRTQVATILRAETSYELWALDLPPGGAQPGDEPFNDGVPNFLKYLLGGAADSPWSSGSILQAEMNEQGEFSAHIFVDPERQDAPLLAEFSLDLKTWHTGWLQAEAMEDGQLRMRLRKNWVSGDDNSRGFFRLKYATEPGW